MKQGSGQGDRRRGARVVLAPPIRGGLPGEGVSGREWAGQGAGGVARGPVSGVPGAQWTRAASKEGVSLGSGSQIARELVGV